MPGQNEIHVSQSYAQTNPENVNISYIIIVTKIENSVAYIALLQIKGYISFPLLDCHFKYV